MKIRFPIQMPMRLSRMKLGLLAVAVLVAGVIIGIVRTKLLQSPFNQAYDRVELGMSVDEVTKILGMPPGYYQVSPSENFGPIKIEGTTTSSFKNFEGVERDAGVFDIVSRGTDKCLARLYKWDNAEDGIWIWTQDDIVIGKMYGRSRTFIERNQWWYQLRQRLGL